MFPKKVREILGPDTKFGSRDALRVVLRVVEDIKHLVREVLRHGARHSDKALHEKVDRMLLEQIERGAHALHGIRPRIVVVQPVTVIDEHGCKVGKTTVKKTNILMSTMPSDQTSAARGR
jgi:hypothetical protein